MNYWIALIYGIIQGVTEFAPVSSSGHLALLPHIIKFKDPGVLFDLSMHMGTLLAVVIYFRKEMWGLIKASLDLLRFKIENYFFANMIISTISTVIAILLVKGIAEQFGRTPIFIIINLSLFAVLMYVADRFFCQDEQMNMGKKIHFKEALMIGLSQSLAIFPGVSRSGITLTISRAMKMTRYEASRYTFLLSVPIIFCGFIYKFPAFINGDVIFDIKSCLFGGIISFFVGIATIHFFMQFISRIGLKYFSLYRIILALVMFVYLVK